MTKRAKSTGAKGPLDGVIVVDMSRVLAGPLCGQILAELGARVIKVEKKGRGDDTRAWGPPFTDGLSAYFLSCNKNKLSIALDLDLDEDKKILHQLVAKADVLIENFLPKSSMTLGLASKDLRKKYPKLIVCSISGFGQNSSWKNVAGYDFAIQALSGFMSITGEPDGKLFKVGVAITDVLTALYSCVGILARLSQQRLKSSKRGVHLDMALLDVAVAAQVNLFQSYLMTQTPPKPQGNRHAQIAPYELFNTKDGAIVLCVGNEHQWQKLCEIFRDKSLFSDASFSSNPRRVANVVSLSDTLQKYFIKQTSSYWEEQLLAAGIPHGRVNNYQEVCKMPLAKERKWFEEVELKSGARIRTVTNPIKSDQWSYPKPFVPELPGQDFNSKPKRKIKSKK